MTHPSPGPPLPQVIGSYAVLDKIGEGGMGLVYRAENRASRERVALKVVRARQPRLLSALRAEIAVLRTIRHPGVVRILEHGITQDGLPWYAMELLEGRTLADFNRSLWGPAMAEGHGKTTTGAGDDLAASATLLGKPNPFDQQQASAQRRASAQQGRVRKGGPFAAGRGREALALYRSMCAPLAYLHARGIVHRDLKPSNLFIRADGTPVLVDFGLIAQATGEGRETFVHPSRALGTLSYVAPEQIEGRLVDARADLYSLGCMLYETLTGQPPFSGKNVLERHQSEPPVPPQELVDGLPPGLNEIVLRLLAKNPQDRFGYPGDVASALSEMLADEVIPSDAIDGAAYLYRPQMTGRHELLTHLGEQRERMVERQGSVVMLGGESGIGKTFLMSEFAQRSVQRRCEVIGGECVPVSAGGGGVSEFRGGPLHPLRPLFQVIADQCLDKPEATERLLGRRAALLSAYEPALARFVQRSDGPETHSLPADAARERLLVCLLETVNALAAERPLVLILDDLHWADDLTLAFLSRLTPSYLAGRRLMVLGTYRSEEVGPELRAVLAGASLRLEMNRLDEKAVESITGDMLAMRAPPPRLVRFLSNQSEGNPFFIAEYLRLLVSEGFLSRSRGRWQIAGQAAELEADSSPLPMPRSLQAIVAHRLASIDRTAGEVIAAAAVIGRVFEVEILAAVTALDPESLAGALREARTRQVIEQIEERRFRFAHDKLRESAYGNLTVERRQVLHARAASAIEAGHEPAVRPFADLAHHYSKAGDTNKAIEYLERAGEEALLKSGYREAVAFLTEAIELSRQEGLAVTILRLARWHQQIGEALHGIGEVQGSAAHLRQAAALLSHPAPTGRLQLAQAVMVGVARQALHRLFPNRFLGTQPEKTDLLVQAARAHDRLMQVLYYTGDALAMFHSCLTCVNVSELATVTTEQAIAYANAHAVAGILPARGLAEDYYRRARAAIERAPDAAADSYICLLAGGYRQGVGDWEACQVELERGLAIARDIGYWRRWEELNSVTSVCQFLQGRFEEALTHAELVWQSAQRGDPQTQCWGLLEKAQALLVLYRGSEAIELIDRACGLLAQGLGRAERLWAFALRALVRLRSGDAEGALDPARLALAEIRKGPPITFVWIEAYAAVAEVFTELFARATDPVARKRLLREARLACAALGPLTRIFPVAAPRRDLWQGRLAWLRGNRTRAEARWRAALAGARQLRMPHDEAQALLALATMSGEEPGQRAKDLDAAEAAFRAVHSAHGLALVQKAHSLDAGFANQLREMPVTTTQEVDGIAELGTDDESLHDRRSKG